MLDKSAVKRFLWWIKERDTMYRKRELEGKPKPWSDDPVMQSVFFTNPHREHDKTTVWFRKNIRDRLRNKPVSVTFATVAFRWFNRIETGAAMDEAGLFEKWDKRDAIKLLKQLNKTGPVFTGAYMIKAGNGPPGSKIPCICGAVDTVWRQRHELPEYATSMEDMWARLKQFPYLGPFMSYEIVCDLRWTCVLEGAGDIDLWSNPGPGATRGLHRLRGEPATRKPLPKGAWYQQSAELLRKVRKIKGLTFEPEMRTVEHSLCEFDKYERARLNQGKIKRIYHGA